MCCPIGITLLHKSKQLFGTLSILLHESIYLDIAVLVLQYREESLSVEQVIAASPINFEETDSDLILLIY